MEKLLNNEIEEQIRQVFQEIKDPVVALFFGSKAENCDYCKDTQQMLEELTALSDKIELQVFDLEENAATAEKYHVTMAPGIAMTRKQGDELVDYGVRFAGIPSGHEFTSLVRSFLLVSSGESGLAPATRKFLKTVKKPVNLQVFITPTCPYCPQAVILAHQLAVESPFVDALMVEAMEFPELSNRYGVGGVPHTTINFDAESVVGAAPESMLIAKIQQALN
ncbi:MAG: thioredoxin family protein [Anaerolineaceae bacterium]|nr:thioredoxin family protein [Anaerolineaceae bacterium]